MNRNSNHQPKRTVLVLGAGIVGTSAALELARTRPNHDIILVERNNIAASATEASGVNCGLLLPMHSPTSHPLAQLERKSMIHYAALAEKYPEITMEANKPTLIACTTIEELEHAHVMAEESEGSFEVLLPQDAAILEPSLLFSSSTSSSSIASSAVGWLHIPSCASADPALATRAGAREAAKLGVRELYSSSVSKVEQLEDGQMRVVVQRNSSADSEHNNPIHTSKGTECVLIVDEIAICCGWRSRQVARDLFRIHVPVFPVTGQMWAVNIKPDQHSPPGLAIRSNILSMESLLAWAQSDTKSMKHTNYPPLSNVTHVDNEIGGRTRITRHLYTRQTSSGELICGGDRIVGSKVPLDISRSHANRAQLEEVLPFVRGLGEIERMWTGIMPWTTDLMPVLGRLPGCGAGRVYVATGLCSHGFSMGPGLGNALAVCMNGDDVHELCNAEHVCTVLSARL